MITALTARFPLTDATNDPEAVDLTSWLEALIDRTGHITIRGIGSGIGRTRDASRYPIEQLYTTLRSRGGTLEGRAGAGTLAAMVSRHPGC